VADFAPQMLPPITGQSMGGMIPFISPDQIAQNQTDMLQWQQKQALAQQLMQAQYQPNTGKTGVGATILERVMGALAQNQQNAKLSDILKQQFQIENSAAQAKRQQDLQDEYRKLQEDILKHRSEKQADLEFAPQTYAPGMGGFDPRTGKVSIDPNLSAADIAKATAIARAQAQAQASVAGAAGGAADARIQRIMAMPDGPVKQALLTKELGEGGMQALTFNSMFSGGGGGGGQGGAGPIGGGGGGAAGGQPTSGAPAGVDPDAWARLNPAMRAQVQAIGEYRQAPLTSMAIRSPMGAALMQAVNQVYPNYDATTYPTRSKARADFTSGAGGKNVNAINTAIEHAGQLLDSADALGNYGGLMTPLNAPKNALASTFGAAAPKQFDQNKEALIGELTKAFRGASGSEKDIEEMRGIISSAGSPEQLHGAVGKAMQLLASKAGSMKEQYDSTMGPGSPNFFSPKAQKALAKLTKAGIDTGDLGADIGAGDQAPAAAVPSLQDIQAELARRGVTPGG